MPLPTEISPRRSASWAMMTRVPTVRLSRLQEKEGEVDARVVVEEVEKKASEVEEEGGRPAEESVGVCGIRRTTPSRGGREGGGRSESTP